MTRLISISLAIVLVFCPAAYAHRPSSITVDASQEIVDIEIKHTSSRPESHYINMVTITVNTKKVITQSFRTQSNDGLTIFYKIPSLKTGDKVTVSATCNLGGVREKTVTVK